ncbi:hypothetical protein BN988_02865 [Oceanobacillus picturae]|uniref:Uncharacterized protein n=1 Tax=Oceanobacillus picturae TaxID=171693 RepID=W9ANU4_9BACI|nr:hypothetical protein [Oceanobacillus picturae]CDO04311.1 hypothetical protein BN988_02865 [Oceanobacillus picturae]
MSFERSIYHDKVLQYLINNNHYFFKAPLYPVDSEMSALRDLLRNQSTDIKEELDEIWNVAINRNPFYKTLIQKFTLHIHNENFIRKVGDVIADLNGIWHLIELKTSKDNIFNINFDSLIAYDTLPIEVRNYIHFIFFDGQCFWMARYNDLNIEPVVHVYEEIYQNLERIRFIRDYNRFYQIQINNNRNTPSHVDRSYNAYVKVDMNKQPLGVVSPIQEHMDKLKNQFSLGNV